jgi:hypothetical protein
VIVGQGVGCVAYEGWAIEPPGLVLSISKYDHFENDHQPKPGACTACLGPFPSPREQNSLAAHDESCELKRKVLFLGRITGSVIELTICINKVDAAIYALGYPVQADEHILLLSSYTRPAAAGHLQPAAAAAAGLTG